MSQDHTCSVTMLQEYTGCRRKVYSQLYSDSESSMVSLVTQNSKACDVLGTASPLSAESIAKNKGISYSPRQASQPGLGGLSPD